MTGTQYLIQKVTSDNRTIDLAIVDEADVAATRQSYRAEITQGSSDWIQVTEA
jgi:hypothetical protein